MGISDRMGMTRIARIDGTVVLGCVLVLAIALSGCASSGGSSSEASSAGSGSSGGSSAAPAAKTTPADVPAGSPLAAIEIGMTRQQVTDLLGQPTRMNNYPTGKNWIPFYFGGDTHRFDWIYPGKGTVVMANTSRFSTALEVVDVIADPSVE
jgi:hypothetical protein